MCLLMCMAGLYWYIRSILYHEKQEERKNGNNATPEFTVRYSPKFLRTEGKERRRGMMVGGILCMIGSMSLVVEGVDAWRTHRMVVMGPRMGFEKYPPELVIALGLVGLVIGVFGLWIGFSTRVPVDPGQDDR
jgi:hypothetical protein